MQILLQSHFQKVTEIKNICEGFKKISGTIKLIKINSKTLNPQKLFINISKVYKSITGKSP